MNPSDINSFKNLNFKIIVLLFTLAIAVMARAEDVEQLKVLTYNVNFGRTDAVVIKILDSLDADIVCLQETTADWEALIRNNLSQKYNYIAFKHCCRAGGLAILSKFPVIKDEYLNNEVSWFPAWVFTVKTSLGEVQLLNVHLKPGINEKGKVGFLAKEFFKAQKTHILELEQFMKFLKPDIPTLILGDCNENDKGKGLKWMKKNKGFYDSLRAFDKHSKTWEWGFLRGRYDHILHNSNLRCVCASVFHCGRSDHFPVSAIFELTTNNKK